jgi:hypothetical protein
MKIVINSKYGNNPILQRFIENLPNRFEQEGMLLFLERNTIKSFVVDESDTRLQNVVVKCYKFPNFIQRIGYSFFRSGKAARAFYNAKELSERGFDTPQEIAYMEKWRNGLFAYSYFISEYDGSPPIREKLLESEVFDSVMAEDFAFFAVKLHEAGILNHDLNSTNVLYHPEGERYRFSLIDINRIDFCPIGKDISRYQCLDNLKQFTGRMDVFEYVVRCYSRKRNWDEEATTVEAIKMKTQYDKQRKRRKAFLRKFKSKK